MPHLLHPLCKGYYKAPWQSKHCCFPLSSSHNSLKFMPHNHKIIDEFGTNQNFIAVVFHILHHNQWGVIVCLRDFWPFLNWSFCNFPKRNSVQNGRKKRQNLAVLSDQGSNKRSLNLLRAFQSCFLFWLLSKH